MSNLRTNFKDDVFEGRRKYTQINNGDGTVSFTDSTQYTQVGDSYGAAQINETNDVVNNIDAKSFKYTDSAETAIADNDYFPFYDTSASKMKKSLWSNIKSVLSGYLAIKNHQANDTTYGAGNASKFGHVKLSDKYTSSDGAAAASVGASSKAVNDSYNANKNSINTLSGTVSTLSTTVGNNYNTLNGKINTLSGTVTSNYNTLNSSISSLSSTVTNNYNTLNSAINTNKQTEQNHYNSLSDAINTNKQTETNHYNTLASAVDTAQASANTAQASANTAQASANAAQASANSAEYNSSVRYNDVVGELTANGNRIYMDYKNGKYGYNTSANRGAGTFVPFSKNHQVYVEGGFNRGSNYAYTILKIWVDGVQVCNIKGGPYDDAYEDITESYTINTRDYD